MSPLNDKNYDFYFIFQSEIHVQTYNTIFQSEIDKRLCTFITNQKESEDELHTVKFKLVGMKNQLQEQEKRVDESQQQLRKVEDDQQTAKKTLDEVLIGDSKRPVLSCSLLPTTVSEHTEYDIRYILNLFLF